MAERGYPSSVWERGGPQPKCRLKVIDTNISGPALTNVIANLREKCLIIHDCQGRHREEYDIGFIEYECYWEMP
jgi:hypothetical protein